ncbi:MAG TPA: 4-hydroxythreonine-4-phosphate dehydrogenase PdxA [Holophagaceae bacterium]
MTRRPRLAITLGDPCGIGPELLVRTIGEVSGWADPIVVGSRSGLELLEVHAERPADWAWGPVEPPFPGVPGEASRWAVRPRGSAAEILPASEVLWLDPTPEVKASGLHLGEGSAASGTATVRAIEVAAQLALAGRVDALVTLPMAKSAAHLAGYSIPGHTEFLRDLSSVPRTCMAFLSPRLSVALHTVHQSLRSVIEELQAQAVADTLSFASRHFARWTGISRPRVALCALNPHAGEAGAFGHEEHELREALEIAQAAWPEACFSGPHPSDSLFFRAVQGEFDLVVALYHDQGLIPIKVLEPDRAVNVTLGLPFIRTSPDHGTAFDKAGRWIARPANFLEAAAMAARFARIRIDAAEGGSR